MSSQDIEADFNHAIKKDTIFAYETFINKYKRYKAFKKEKHFLDKASFKIEELYYKYAKTSNSIIGYDEYLRRYPQGTFLKDVKSNIKELYFKERPLLPKDIKNVKIVVDINYENFNDIKDEESISGHYYRVFKEFIECAGYYIERDEKVNANTTMKIVGKIKLIGAPYKNPKEKQADRIYYTSATVFIQNLTFESNGNNIFEIGKMSHSFARFPFSILSSTRSGLNMYSSNAISEFDESVFFPRLFDKLSIFGTSALIRFAYRNYNIPNGRFTGIIKEDLKRKLIYLRNVAEGPVRNALKYIDAINKSQGRDSNIYKKEYFIELMKEIKKRTISKFKKSYLKMNMYCVKGSIVKRKSVMNYT